MKKLISWDVGTVNLSYCKIKYDENDINNWKILRWENIKIMDKHISNSVIISKTIFEKLMQDKTRLIDVDKCIIESQSNIRGGMEAVTAALTMFYCFNGITDINSINAKQKFKVYPQVIFEKGKKNYQKRKKECVKSTIQLLIELNYTSELNFLNQYKSKKDDLCDSLNLALAFIEYKFSFKTYNNAKNKYCGNIE